MRGTGEIGLLPRQPLITAPLPGENLELQFKSNSRQCRALHAATERDFGLVAMQLLTPAGNIAAVAPLLEVVSISSAAGFTFADVRCVGRARLRTLEGGSGRATISAYRDADTDVVDSDSTSLTARVLQRTRELHHECYLLSQELAGAEELPLPERLRAPIVPVPGGAHRAATGSPAAPVPGVRMARRPANFVNTLTEQAACQRSALLAQAAAECMWPSPSLERLPLWSGSGDGLPAPPGLASSEAELVLLSFAACAALSPFERLRALETPRTLERLRRANDALARQRDRLSATLALRRIGVESPR
eukprot:941628-Prymnesium_polylepis.2